MIEIQLTGSRESVELALFRLGQAFSSVTASPIHESATAGVFTARALCTL